jgi:hypothetical protein
MTVSAYLFSVVKGRQVYGVFSNFSPGDEAWDIYEAMFD